LRDCTSSTYSSTPPGGSKQTPCTNPKFRAKKKNACQGQITYINTWRKRLKKSEKCAQMRAYAHERYLAGAKMNADRWVIEECKIGWVEDKID